MRWQAAQGPDQGADSLGEAWRRSLAVPVLGPAHQALRERAITWTATAADGEAVCLRVADGLLFELLGGDRVDSEFLAAVYRDAGPAAAVRRVCFRSDDSWLLPFAMTGRPPEQVEIRARLLVLGPRPWHECQDWRVLDAPGWAAEQGAPRASEQAGPALAVECPEGDPALERLLQEGFVDAVQVFEIQWTQGP